MAAIDPLNVLETALVTVHGFMVRDLMALPESSLALAPNETTMSPLAIVAHCAMSTQSCAAFLQGVNAPRLSPAEREAHIAQFDSREKVLEYLQQSIDTHIKAIRGLDPESLADVSNEPFGFPMSRYAIANLPTSHMMFHDGQLNYVQCLNGDKEFHWF